MRQWRRAAAAATASGRAGEHEELIDAIGNVEECARLDEPRALIIEAQSFCTLAGRRA